MRYGSAFFIILSYISSHHPSAERFPLDCPKRLLLLYHSPRLLLFSGSTCTGIARRKVPISHWMAVANECLTALSSFAPSELTSNHRLHCGYCNLVQVGWGNMQCWLSRKRWTVPVVKVRNIFWGRHRALLHIAPNFWNVISVSVRVQSSCIFRLKTFSNCPCLAQLWLATRELESRGLTRSYSS